MSVLINADTSDGLKFTSDTSGEIKLQSAGADIATVSSTGIAMAAGKTLPAAALTGTVPSSSVDALSTASGSAPSYSARAWVNFNGTGTVAIRASGNVTSITDNGTGLFTINLTTAMPDANYCSTISSGSGAGASGDGTSYRNNIAAGSFQVETFNPTGNAAVDYAYVGVAVFR